MSRKVMNALYKVAGALYKYADGTPSANAVVDRINAEPGFFEKTPPSHERPDTGPNPILEEIKEVAKDWTGRNKLLWTLGSYGAASSANYITDVLNPKSTLRRMAKSWNDTVEGEEVVRKGVKLRNAESAAKAANAAFRGEPVYNKQGKPIRYTSPTPLDKAGYDYLQEVGFDKSQADAMIAQAKAGTLPAGTIKPQALAVPSGSRWARFWGRLGNGLRSWNVGPTLKANYDGNGNLTISTSGKMRPNVTSHLEDFFIGNGKLGPAIRVGALAIPGIANTVARYADAAADANAEQRTSSTIY